MKAAKLGGIVAVALLLMYVLSYGPATAWWARSLGSYDESKATREVFMKRSKIYGTVYAPLNWLGRQSKVVERALGWYVALWVNRPRERGR